MTQMQKFRENCPCCNIEQEGTAYREFHEFGCNECQHVWYSTATEVTPEIYEESPKYNNYYIGEPPLLWYHKKALDWLATLEKSSRVLDFGCFDGFFTKKLIQSGWNAFGCDWNKRAIERGRLQYGLGDRLGVASSGTFDAIIALEVIEHFINPNDFLEMMDELLTTEGYLFISCPNSSAVYRPKTDFPPHHFSRFSKNSLITLLESHEYQVVDYAYETSIFQLLRNFFGDLARRDSELKIQSEPTENKPFRELLKSIANTAASPLNTMLRPADLILNRLGVAYLSHVVVAQRRN